MSELKDLIAEIDTKEYGERDLAIDIEHLYHHLNTAWNSRNSTDRQAKECTEHDFNQWRRFPDDIDMEP